MRSRRIWALVILCACKAEVGGDFRIDGDAGLVDATATDAAIDAAIPLGPWGAPRLVPGANTTLAEDDGTLTSSLLEMVFAKEDPNDNGRKHLFYISRDTPTSTTWTPPIKLPINVNGTTDQTPRFSDDDLILYFGSNRAGTAGDLDIWQSVRPAVGGAWGGPTRVPNVNSTSTDKWWAPCDGGRYLMISSRGGNGEDIYEGVGAAAPTRVAELSSNDGETGTFLTRDCLTAYFASTRSGSNRIYMATRPTVAAAWSAPVLFDDFQMAVPGTKEDPWLAADGRTFVFSSGASGSKDVYISTR